MVLSNDRICLFQTRGVRTRRINSKDEAKMGCSDVSEISLQTHYREGSYLDPEKIL